MWPEFSNQKNAQEGFGGFDISDMFLKGRIKRMFLTFSAVGSFRNGQKQENPNEKKQVIHRFPH